MPDARTAPTRRLIHQRRPHRGSPQPVHYSISCPTCGHRALLGLTYTDQPHGQPPVATVVRFRCTNQMARIHRSPSNTELLAFQ